MMDDFAVFILTHGRANNVVTYETLMRKGYSGRWYVVIDNEDEQENQYRERFGEHVLQFDKVGISKRFDTMDVSNERRTVVYARNACWDLARKIGVRYFVELDDDYKEFEFRYPYGGKLCVKSCENVDKLFDAMLQFLIDTKADTVAMAQGGDFIGGIRGGNYKKKCLRKVMNTFFCDVERPFDFIGRINEDVYTYCCYGSRGWLALTTTEASITQQQTQKNAGGMSDVYLDSGTYLKSFYTVMVAPSCVKIGVMGDKHLRIHHRIDWDCCVPKIINARWKKGCNGNE